MRPTLDVTFPGLPPSRPEQRETAEELRIPLRQKKAAAATSQEPVEDDLTSLPAILQALTATAALLQSQLQAFTVAMNHFLSRHGK